MFRVCHSLYAAVTVDTLFVTVFKVICTVDARCFPSISRWDRFLIVIHSPLIDSVLHDLLLSQRLCLFSWEGLMHCMWSCYSCRPYGSFPSLGDKSYVFQVLWSSVQSMSSTSFVSFADGSILDAFLAHSESINDGLSLSLFSVEEKVQIDLLQTFKKLRAPLIAYKEIMKWASRSCLQGYSFHDAPIMSQKGIVDKLKVCVDVKSLQPLVEEVYLPYSKCFGEVVYFSAHSIFGSFLSCTELNQDKNFIFNDDNNPDCNPFAKPNGAADRAAILETERIACSFFIWFFELPGPSLGAVTSWHFLKGCSVNTPSMFRGNGRGEDMGYKVRVVAPDANLL